MEYLNYISLFLLAFSAGFIDSSVGGGGFIQLPALLIFAGGLPIPTIMGTNKFAAVSGTAISTLSYIRQTEVPWKSIIPAIITAFIFSFLGANIISNISQGAIKIIVLVLLVGAVTYTYFKKDFGAIHHPKLTELRAVIYSLITGMVLGFYDGFFGPGTGSFLIMAFIGLFGFSFLMSSVSAKLVNCATGVSALSYFMYTNQIVYSIAIPVALFNIMGSFIGTQLAIKKGSKYIRTLFLTVISLMIIKLAYNML